MKKRLRKKKHLCEFKQFGWYVEYELSERSEEEEFWDLMLDEIDSIGLEVGGATTSFFTTPRKGASLEQTYEKRQQLHSWLQQQPGITGVTSSPLTDAWYGPFQN
ncbi:50S ribosome-binding protein YggL [Hymenobacter sp.]|jgi:uncharacterized protein YggL (DUF469 family)|uniref:50S ribosome-binding protein YggL n=1 Tax=Hymenobacter sp. TaxID=1898978 RepID=UPI002ED9E052